MDFLELFVDFVNFLRNDINRSYLVVLCKKCGYGESYISCTRHSNFQVFEISHCDDYLDNMYD